MARARRSRKLRKPLTARVKVWIEADGQYVFGFGMSKILKAVDETGSIKTAADRLGKSYRHIWGRIKEAEAAVGEPLVNTRVGGAGAGRSSLTDLAMDLVADYDALRARMLEVVQSEFASRFPATTDP